MSDPGFLRNGGTRLIFIPNFANEEGKEPKKNIWIGTELEPGIGGVEGR